MSPVGCSNKSGNGTPLMCWTQTQVTTKAIKYIIRKESKTMFKCSSKKNNNFAAKRFVFE